VLAVIVYNSFFVTVTIGYSTLKKMMVLNSTQFS